jgi:nucleoside-diphosphate-sugar epimerase
VAQTAIAEGVPLVSLVPGVVYGPGEATEGNLVGRMVRDHLAGRLPGLIGADRCWSYAYVNDVADAHVSALTPELPTGEYLLGGDNARQMRVFEIVRAETGAALPRRIPFALASAAGWVEEKRAGMTGRPPVITRGIVDILRHDWSMDSATSVKALNYRVTSLETGIRALLSANA